MNPRLPPLPSPPRRRLLQAAAASFPLLAVTGLSGCATAWAPFARAPFDYRAPDAPVALERPPHLQPAPRIALALGSGGPRGYAHLGVLAVLEEAGIVPDLVAGSSVGALIGTFWASGLNAAALRERALDGGPLTVFDPSPFADRGWIHGQRLQDYVTAGIGGRPLEALPRRVIVTAARRDDKAPRYFMRGHAGVAVRASGAMPGIVSPVGIGGVEYEDGDEAVPVPVSAARATGARFVIAVDVSALPGSTPADAPPAMRERDHRRRLRIEPEVAQADFLLHPDLGYWAGPRRSYFLECLRRGEAHARERLPALRAALQQALGPSA